MQTYQIKNLSEISNHYEELVRVVFEKENKLLFAKIHNRTSRPMGTIDLRFDHKVYDDENSSTRLDIFQEPEGYNFYILVPDNYKELIEIADQDASDSDREFESSHFPERGYNDWLGD